MSQPAAPNARRLAHALLVRVEATQAYSDRVLDATLNKAAPSPQDRALITELAYGTLRHLDSLDAQLDALLSKPIATLPAGVRAALRLGAYQLLMMRVPAYSAVNESVKLVGRKYGALAGVVNGVLRSLARQQAALLEPGAGGENAQTKAVAQSPEAKAAARRTAVAAHPPWLQAHIVAALGADEGGALMEANLTRPNVSVRVNTTRITAATLLQQLADAGVQAVPQALCKDSLTLPPAGSVQDLPGFKEGLMAVQDGAATLVGHLLAPPEHGLVLDMCAAPGGKAMHAACMMNNTGHVIACDVHPGRLRLIERNAERLGHHTVTPLLADMSSPQGAAAVAALIADNAWPEPSHVVLDAPCSALGTLRRHPELRRKDGANIAALTLLQRELLDVAQTFVPVGGMLVYAVCTLTQAEGPDQVAAFLARHQDFELEQPSDALAAVRDGCFVRTWPHRHGLDGFFAARLRRRAAILRTPAAIP